MPSPARLLLIEDEELIRSLLVEHLRITRPELEVVETGDGLEAWDLFKQLTPPYVITDMMLPSMDGRALLHLMARHHAPPRVMVLTGRTSQEQLAELGRSLNFISLEKGASLAQVDAGVKELIDASPLMPMEKRARADAAATEGLDRLTARERMVVSLVASGLRSRDISGVLGLSLHTVHAHRRNILKKLQMHSSTQLVVFAVEHGLAKVRFA